MTTAYEVHPSIGIARVGVSDKFFIGPEPGGAPPVTYRDAAKNLLRQACRFRVYKCDRDDRGKLLSAEEVTAASARIVWTVELANRKAANKKFDEPGNRNAKHANRDELMIRPPAVTVDAQKPTAKFDTGTFLGVKVDLGEVQVESGGQLLVLGGHGKSGYVSTSGQPVKIEEFANNDLWYDDVSDGPIRASITLNGAPAAIEAKAAWIIVAPPDFAPEVQNFVTLYDVALQVAVDRGWLQAPQTPSFTRHIYPILSRAVGYQWVNEAAQRAWAGRRRRIQ